MIADQFDVIVVGGGPTGLATAALLGRRGWRVAVFEKHPGRYGLPRAGHIDHEILRILQGVGAHQPVIDDDAQLASYDWYNGEGKRLLSFPFGEPSVSGFQSDYMLFQPVLDDALYAAIDAMPSATVELGAPVTALDQDADGVTVLKDGHEIRARYVVAADGAGSVVRDVLLGIGRIDHGFNEQWLDIDVRLKRPLPLGINGQWCDPRRPMYIGPLGRRHHRFECAVLPGETLEEVLRPQKVWEVLDVYGVGPEDVEPFRQVVYTFESRVARRWRDGRVLLAGDAAHTMPPFMGQGLCSGIRDAANLAWKLDLVLAGVSDETLLDSYEQERRPHVERWIELSVAVGKLSCVLDPAAAAVRDQALLTNGMPPLPAAPTLAGELLQRDAAGLVVAPAGELFVQAEVTSTIGTGLLHDVFGHGWLVVSTDGSPASILTAPDRGLLETLGASLLWLGGEGPGGFEDPSGRVRGFFARYGITVAVVRPDYYVVGGAKRLDGLPRLLAMLHRGLAPQRTGGRADSDVTCPTAPDP